jgi:outer membrane protein assembly factor BamB
MLFLLSSIVLGCLSLAQEPADGWPHWRGPRKTGVAPGGDPPRTWSEAHNVRWKLALPGLGHSSPVIAGDLLFVTTAIPTGDRVEPQPDLAPGAHDNQPVTHRQLYAVIAVDRSRGAIRWQTTVHEDLPHEGGHVSASYASASPITDGEQVYASFGSAGLYALDLDGTLRWSSKLGRMQSKHGHGEGSSPDLFGDTLVINWDHEGDSFVVALDTHTGKERWRVPREEVTSWSSPLALPGPDGPHVVVSGSGRIRSYDLATGAVRWECGGLSRNVVASPVAGGGLVFAGSSYEKQVMIAIRLEGARGDLTRSDRIAWVRRSRTPYVPSPLLYDDALYFLLHYQGILARVDAASGDEPTGPFRLSGLGDLYASPVAAAGRLFLTDRDGTTLVLTHASEPQLLARNRLDDSFSASAAIVGECLYLRGERFLYCLAETD